MIYVEVATSSKKISNCMVTSISNNMMITAATMPMHQQLLLFAQSIFGKRLLFRYCKSSPTLRRLEITPCHGTPARYFASTSSSAVLAREAAAAMASLTSSSSSTYLLMHHNPKIQHPHQQWFSSSSSTDQEKHKRIILTHALHHVHDDGWTDDAIASGTLDAKLPPSYIGMLGDGLSYHSSSSSLPLLGNADLVAFFMEECNATLRNNLSDVASEVATSKSVSSMTREEYDHQILSSRISKALHLRLSMVLPYVKSNRWHEGMAIGALPQNAVRTIQQLDAMATIVLDYATSSVSEMGGDKAMVSKMPTPALRTAIVAAYAAAELHLLSDGKNTTFSTIGGKPATSLRGDEEHYRDTWKFLEARSAEVARFIVHGGTTLPFSSMSSLPHPTHVITAATAVASSLAGAALSLASPAAAAAMAGHVHALPNSLNALSSAFTFLENVVSSTTRQPATTGGATTSTKMRRDGTRPSDYTAETSPLPPFDTSEDIFSGAGIGRK